LSHNTHQRIFISSRKDAAGSNIRQRLLEGWTFDRTGKMFDASEILSSPDGRVLLIESSKEIIFQDDLDSFFGGESSIIDYVFISRHRAESGIPSLTAHFTGNFQNENEYGGMPREIAKCNPNLLKNYLISLNSIKSDIPGGFKVTLEATHHGPTSLQHPVLFVELGSTADQWTDKLAGRAVAKALMKSIDIQSLYSKTAIGFGGSHYSEKFTKLLIETDLALGPIASKYALDFVDEGILEQMIKKTQPQAKEAALDWKGMGPSKSRIVNLVGQFGLEIIRI
jgi:D-aminoacyl-tRNA deacylase